MENMIIKFFIRNNSGGAYKDGLVILLTLYQQTLPINLNAPGRITTMLVYAQPLRKGWENLQLDVDQTLFHSNAERKGWRESHTWSTQQSVKMGTFHSMEVFGFSCQVN